VISFMRDILINVRSQNAPLTGVQRYIREMCEQMKGRVRRVAPRRPLLGIAGHLWEQSILPGLVKEGLLWSPGNTGPLRVARQVVTIHDVAPMDHPEWFNTKFAQWYKWLTPRLVKRAQRVVTVSNFSKSRLVELTGVDESRIIVIPNGVNRRFYPRPAGEIESVKRRLGVPSSRYVLSLGSIEPRKNLARLLLAWSRCQGQLDDDISLVVAGGLGARRIYSDVPITIAPPRVHFTASVPDDCLPALYSGAIALIYPSIYEGFGLPVAEAMASGCVSIVSGSTSLPEVVGNAGITIDPLEVEELADALVTICRDETLRNVLRERAIQQSARFRWERAAKLVLDVLEQAAA
jgi:glycosyltransferase involved in cell wall biosynthesis